MSKRNLLNLFLLSLILVLIALVVIEPGKKQPLTPPDLTKLNADDIQHIRIQRPNNNAGQQEIVFKKTLNGWILIRPYQQAANTFRIDSILKLLSAVSLSQNDLQTLDPAQFGLDKPQASITFNNTTIVFGHNKSLKNHRYVKIGSTLHMIADTFLYQLTAKAESYVSHKVLPDKNKITKLILPNIKLQQTDGRWLLTPKADNFSADSVNQLISEWQLSQAYDLNFVKPQPETKADVSIYLDNGQVMRFKITNSKELFNLTNIDNGIRYMLAKDRSHKLLSLSAPEQ